MALQMSRAQTTPVTFAQTRPRVSCAAPAIARLSSGASRMLTTPVRQAPVNRAAVRRTSAVVTRAGGLSFDPVPDNKAEWSPVIGILGLAAWTYNRISLNAPQLLKALAIYQLGISVLALGTQSGNTDHIGSTVAPGVLAAAVLNLSQVSYMDAAIVGFGYFLASSLEGNTWAWLATLAVAIYTGYPSHWFVAASGLLAGLKLYRAQDKGEKVSAWTIPTVLGAVYAIWKEVTPQFTIALILGQVLTSGLSYVESVVDA